MSMVTQVFDALCSWDNPMHTLAALIIYNLAVWNFQPYMVPLGMIVGIFANRHPSRHPFLLDIVSSARAAYGVGAGNLNSSSLRREQYLAMNSLESDDEGVVVGSLPSSQEQDDHLVINNQLMSSLESDYLGPVEVS